MGKDYGKTCNPYIEEEQTTQWPKEKVQKDKQRSTKHTHKTKDQVTRTPTRKPEVNSCAPEGFAVPVTSFTIFMSLLKHIINCYV